MNNDYMTPKETVDYVTLIFRQIDRCMSGSENFSREVENLKSLVRPFIDDQFKEQMEKLETEYLDGIAVLRDRYSFDYYGRGDKIFVGKIYDITYKTTGTPSANRRYRFWESKYQAYLDEVNSLDRMIAQKKLNAIIDLLNRQGILIERLRVGRE